MNAAFLYSNIEGLREKLNKLVSIKDIELTSKEVIKISQELDETLNELHKSKRCA